MIRIATLNTLLFYMGPRGLFHRVPDREKRLSLMGPWIKKIAPDILFLQEVTRQKDFNRLLKDSKMPFGFFAGQGSGLAILSKHPLQNPKYHPFRWQGSTKARAQELLNGNSIGVATATFKWNAKNILLGLTHSLARFAWLEGYGQAEDSITPERKANFLEIVEGLKNHGSQPLIFGGDLNMNQASAEYPFFVEHSGLVDTYRTICERHSKDWKKETSFYGGNPYVQIQNYREEGILDYIFCTQDFEIVDSHIDSECDILSDHRAVISTLKLKDLPMGIKSRSASAQTREQLKEYMRSVSPHPLMWLNTRGRKQRKEILNFLNQ